MTNVIYAPVNVSAYYFAGNAMNTFPKELNTTTRPSRS